MLEGKRRGGRTPHSGPVGGRPSQGSWLQPEAAFSRSGVSPSGASQGGGSWADQFRGSRETRVSAGPLLGRVGRMRCDHGHLSSLSSRRKGPPA